MFMLLLLHRNNLASPTTRHQDQAIAVKPHHQASAGKKSLHHHTLTINCQTNPQILKYLNTIFANRNIPVAAINEAFGELDIVWRSNGPKLHKLRKLVVLEIMSDKGLNAYYEFRR
ncbi:hypothetical protein ES332_A13G184200v1 [Gossypium tomentosum]|uniref:Uncharacterized protein n=1 Tax=Gossypium tomentosum TaxID=34277 RepID=A0A5D2MLT8_GOSTO|nr:hypothetical protein ES332_A13G184200v1 [Gossypium tomentosum]